MQTPLAFGGLLKWLDEHRWWWPCDESGPLGCCWWQRTWKKYLEEVLNFQAMEMTIRSWRWSTEPKAMLVEVDLKEVLRHASPWGQYLLHHAFGERLFWGLLLMLMMICRLLLAIIIVSEKTVMWQTNTTQCSLPERVWRLNCWLDCYTVPACCLCCARRLK